MASGTTCSVRPSTERTISCSPSSCGPSSAIASQRSPSTPTWPLGMQRRQRRDAGAEQRIGAHRARRREPRGDHLAGDAEEEDAEGGRHDQDQHGRDRAVGRAVDAEEHERAERGREQADPREGPVRRDVRLGDEQDDAEPEQRDPRPRERDDREPEQPEQQAHAADQARQDDAGMQQLEDDPADAEQEEQPDQVGVGQDQQQPRLPADAMGIDARAGDVHGQVLVGQRASVDLPQQPRQRRGDDVGDVHPDRLRRRPVARARGTGGRARRDRALRERGVAAVLGRERPHLGARVVDDLAAQVAAEVRAGRRDRDRGARVRGRRERGDVGGLHDHEAGAGRACALGPHVHDHREPSRRARRG